MSAFFEFGNTAMWLLQTTWEEKNKLCKCVTINMVHIAIHYLNKNLRALGKLTQMAYTCTN